MFVRDEYLKSLVLDKISPEYERVQKGEGVATRKYDGTCCMTKNSKLFKRRTVKQHKISPPNFMCVDIDTLTGIRIG
ncbi:MAG TPA: hypothetical protein ENI76_06315 [Ignavibacteria bacterium]|nr:hypothetical protein [Ignavibacteria bacterium]